MDKNSEVANFEEYLKKNLTKKRIPLYSNSKQVDITVCKPKDVLLNVSTQLKAIQSADIVKCERKQQKHLYLYKKYGFLPIKELPVTEEVSKRPTPSNKFETQFVTDTQLINIIEDAEALNTHKGMTQEFDNSFSHSDSCLRDRVVTYKEQQNPGISNKDEGTSIKENIQEFKISIAQEKDAKIDDNDKLSIENDINTQTDGGLTELLNNCIEIDEEDSEKPPSPIFNPIKSIIKSSNPSPLVYTLKSFEEFEKIAVPLIDDNVDMDKAKHLINSQILDKELFLNQDIRFNFEQLSPVLEIKKEKDKKLNKIGNNETVTSAIHNNSLEDEILFSSDEEIDYIHKELQDLPFTCALETSFYDTSDVLDKTMYVGFQTASNKSIQINSDSFTKAQSILTDFDKDIKTDPTLTELVKVFDVVKCDDEQSEIDSIVKAVKTGFDEDNEINEHKIKSDDHTNSKDDTNDKSIEILQKKELIPDIKQIPLIIDSIADLNHNNSKRHVNEFTTSSNKRIKLSEQALERCRKIIQDIDFDEVLDTQTNLIDIDSKNENVINLNNEDIPKSPKGNVAVVDNEFKLEDKMLDTLVQDKINDDLIIQEFENIEMSLEEDKSTKEANFVRFKTASKENISISNDALKKCQQIFQDIDFNEQMDEVPSKDGKILETMMYVKNKDNNTLLHYNNIEASKEETVPQFSGFKTASNKQIDVSEQALANSMNIFKDLGRTDLVLNNIPEESKEDTEILLKIDYNRPSTSKATFGGFKTANNRVIKISKDALAKTKNVFKNIDKEEPAQLNKDTFGFKGYKTASNKQVNVSEKSKVFSYDKNILNQTDFTEEPNLDFRKSKDNPQKISEEALIKSKKPFKDINVMNNYLINSQNIALVEPPPVFQGFKTASNKAVNISTEALARSKKIFQDIDVNSEPVKKDSKDAIAQSKKLFQGVGPSNISKEHSIEFENKVDNAVTKFQGFKTASNKAVRISDDALLKSMKLLQDIDSISDEMPLEAKSNSRNEANLAFQGFKTASNKTVKISDDALLKSKKLLQDIDSISDEMPLEAKSNSRNEANLAFQGFKTASNKTVKISDDALLKSKKLLQDIDSINDERTLDTKSKSRNEANLAFQGFIKTASNKAVKISDDALLKSKKLLQDIDSISDERTLETKSNSRNEANLAFQGFKTASNKAVKISDDALLKSKKLLQDIDSISDEMPLETKSNSRNEANLAFQGFKTASNKAVKISDDALLKSKKLLQDIDSISDEMPLDSKVKPQNVVLKGFMSANNKTVKIDAQALAKSKKLFDEIPEFNFKNDTKISYFEGFKTGNNKDVEISEKALATRRKVFEDIGCSQILNMRGLKGFQTANKERVNISEDALIESKKLFQNLDVPNNLSLESDFKRANELDALSENNFAQIDNDPSVHSNKDAKPKCDMVEIIDTQVLNDFEETLYTEDFRKSPKRNKRSGSPILSCPRAKKRKFETPYKTIEMSTNITVSTSKQVIVDENQSNFIFDANYKKNKSYTLKDMLKLEDCSNQIKEKYILSVNFDDLLQFEFNKERNDINDHILTMEELKVIFMTSVNKNLIPKGWIENHLQLIIWKLISYEIKFPKTMKNVCTARNVIEQLKYRYDKELYNAQRPVLRKILEKDDTSMRTMVLCVVKIFVDGAKADSFTNTTNIELLLSDGWYCVKATIDKMLTKLVCAEKIVVGTKIVTNGAELVNCEQGVAPWEDTTSVRLKIFGNSTRRARWDARLGCHSNAAMLTHLSSVKLDGGKVSKLRVYVTRVYPALYVEKFEDGSTVTRSERLEHLHQMKYEAERQVLMEKLYEEVEKEFADQDLQDSESFNASNKRPCLDSGSQIAKMMKWSKDPMEFKNNLTHSQHALLSQYTNAHRERLLHDIQDRIRQKMAKNGLCATRNVVPVMKVRVAGVDDRSGVEVTKGMMSIWKPNDAIQEIITEGAWIDVMNVVPTAIRYSEIQISAGRQSVFNLSKYKESDNIKPYTKLLKRTCYLLKDLATNPTSTTDYNEIDTVGMIFTIDPSITDFESLKGQTFQNVYLADADNNIICINFWGGLKKFGFENVLDTGQIVSCTNLQKRAGNTKKNIPQYRVTEFTYFTKTPKNEEAKKIMDELNKKLLGLDKRKFCEDCIVLRNNFTICKVQNNENISPYRLNNSDYNISKHRMFIDTPKRIDDFNLTGLDFESSFKQTETQELSPKSLERKRRVNEKISKLRMYGEPPPLSKIHIINKSKNASSSYKSPLISKSDFSKSVVNVENNPEDSPKTVISRNNSRIDVSPVISMNKTYVKRSIVNPVKLNFSDSVAIEENGVETDGFADEFDGSPPLSFD